jgi:hypothetical protein
MRKQIVVDGETLTVSNTGWSHEVDMQHSTGLRFERADGSVVMGRYRVEAERIDSVSDAELAQAFRIALDPSREN